MSATCENCGRPAEYNSEICLCPECDEPFDSNDPICDEHGGQFDDNPGKNICKTCEDWLVDNE